MKNVRFKDTSTLIKKETSSTATGFKQQLSLNNGSRRLTKKLHLLITEQMVKMMLIKISTVQTLHPPLDHIYSIYVYKCYC